MARMAARIDKAAFTRADMVELVGAQLPVDAPGDPRALIEQIVDEVGVRVSAPREAHHREGHEMFTVDAVIAEEERIFDMVDAADNRARLDVRAEDLGDLSADQARAIAQHRELAVFGAAAASARPARAKRTRCSALRAAAHRASKEVLVLAPTGKAVDEAMRDGAGDRGLTVAKALQLIEDDQLSVDRRTVVVVDEASMVGTPELRQAAGGQQRPRRAKMVLVGDAYQLAPVKARGGMFEQLCERPAVVAAPRRGVADARPRRTRRLAGACASGHGNRLRKAVGWYRNHDRLHTGDPIAMAADATAAYITSPRRRAKTSRSCATPGRSPTPSTSACTTASPTPTLRRVRVARDQAVRVGDLIMSRNNDATMTVRARRTAPPR